MAPCNPCEQIVKCQATVGESDFYTLVSHILCRAYKEQIEEPLPHSFLADTDVVDPTIAEGGYTLTIQVKSGTAVINGLTYSAGQFKTFVADRFRTLPEVVVSGGATVSWEKML